MVDERLISKWRRHSVGSFWQRVGSVCLARWVSMTPTYAWKSLIECLPAISPHLENPYTWQLEIFGGRQFDGVERRVAESGGQRFKNMY